MREVAILFIINTQYQIFRIVVKCLLIPSVQLQFITIVIVTNLISCIVSCLAFKVPEIIPSKGVLTKCYRWLLGKALSLAELYRQSVILDFMAIHNNCDCDIPDELYSKLPGLQSPRY